MKLRTFSLTSMVSLLSPFPGDCDARHAARVRDEANVTIGLGELEDALELAVLAGAHLEEQGPVGAQERRRLPGHPLLQRQAIGSAVEGLPRLVLEQHRAVLLER